MTKKLADILNTFKSIHSDLALVSTGQIVVAEWVRYKCMYGCPNYGQRLSCPPFSPTPEDTRKLLAEYSNAVIVHSQTSPEPGKTPAQQHRHVNQCRDKLHRSVIDMERAAFLAGYYKAFALGATPCYLCKTCVVKKKPQSGTEHPWTVPECRHRDIMRPPMDAFGIDIFQTVKNAGYGIGVLQTYSDTADLYALLLIE
jgi:predicted metal-binding protein